MLQEFKTFIVKGNVLDLAVGVIIGAAFGKIVNSAVNDLIMPVVGLVMGKVDFSNLFISLKGGSYPTVAAAKAAGGPASSATAYHLAELPDGCCLQEALACCPGRGPVPMQATQHRPCCCSAGRLAGWTAAAVAAVQPLFPTGG